MEVGVALNYFNTDSRESYINHSVMLSFFGTKDLYVDLKEGGHLDWIKSNVRVLSVHLPNRCVFPGVIELTVPLIDPLIQEKLLILHPPHKNYPLDELALEMMNSALYAHNAYLCWENFPWKRDKSLRSPFEIAELCSKYDRFKMTFDTSHIDRNSDFWLSEDIMRYLKKYIKVIHLSNKVTSKKQERIGEIQQYRGNNDFGQHLPPSRGELKLDSFIRMLINNLHWDGQIIIEMMPCYDNILWKQIHIVNGWLK